MKITGAFIMLLLLASNVFAQDGIPDSPVETETPDAMVSEGEPVRDPFAASLPEEEVPAVAADNTMMPAQQLVLQGVAIGTDKSGAVINGKFYRVGERKDGFELTAVRKKEADVLSHGSPRTLTLITESLRKKQKQAESAGTETQVESSAIPRATSETVYSGEDMSPPVGEEVK